MPQRDLLEYYIERSDARLDAIEKKIDKLISFRWMLIGAASGVSFVVSLVFKVIEAVAGGK